MRARTTALVVLLLAGAALLAIVAQRHRYAAVPPTLTSTSSESRSSPISPATDGTPRADVTLDTRRQQLIGVRTVPVRRASLPSEIRAVGTVTYDETRQAEINTRVDGWIRELYADYTGRSIRRGELLFTLYSPDLISTQNEYLLALRGQSHGGHDSPANVQQYADRLVNAARDRLLRLDMTDEQIEQLRTTGRPSDTIAFGAPVSGVIVEKAAVRGMRVMAGQMLYRVADLSTVWVDAEIYERDLGAIRPGTAAKVSLQAYPDRSFAGRVTFVSPIVAPETRTVKTRITLANTRGLLKPNMLATVDLRVTGADALVVPLDAVVETGTQRVVFVSEGAGRFTPREVRVGRRTSADVEVISGLAEGEQVAASATFFLDSESQLRSALRTYEPAPPADHASHRAAPDVDVTFRVQPDPPRAGEVTFTVSVSDAARQPVAGAQVRVVLLMAAMPAMNMPAARADATLLPASDGAYRGTAVVTMAGRWDATVTIAKERRTLATRQFALLVR